MKCKIIFERDPKTLKVTDKIKAVKAPNGQKSILFDDIKNQVVDDKLSLETYYKTYTDEFKTKFGGLSKDKNDEVLFEEVKDIILPSQMLAGVEDDILFNNSSGTQSNNIRSKYFADNDTQSHKDILQKIVDDNKSFSPLAKKLLTINSKNIPITLKPVNSLYTFTDDNGNKQSAAGLYINNKIEIAEFGNFKGGEYGFESNVIHEILHAFTYNELRVNTKNAQELKAIYNEALKYKDSFSDQYSISNIDEFLVAIFTNANFIKDIQKIPSIYPEKHQSLWEDILEFFKKWFKFNDKESSLLDDAFYVANKILIDYSDDVANDRVRYKEQLKKEWNELLEEEYVWTDDEGNPLASTSDPSDTQIEDQFKLRNEDGSRKRYTETKAFELARKLNKANPNRPFKFTVIKIMGEKGDNRVYHAVKVVERLDEMYSLSNNNNFYQLNDKIKSDKSDKAIEELDKHLLNSMKVFGVQFKEFEELKSKIGVDALGATDVLNKLIWYVKDRNSETVPEEVGHMAVMLMGENHPDIKELLIEIKNWSEYNDIYNQYMPIYNNEKKVKVEALGKLIAKSLVKNYKANGLNKSLLEKALSSLQKLLENALSIFNMFNYSENIADKIAINLLIGNTSYIGDLKSAHDKLDYHKAIENNPLAKLIIDDFGRNLGNALTGSLAIAGQGEVIYRDSNEPIHDLDFIVDGTDENKLSKLENQLQKYNAVPIHSGWKHDNYTTYAYYIPKPGYKVVVTERERGWVKTIKLYDINNKEVPVNSQTVIGTDFFIYNKKPNTRIINSFASASDIYSGKLKLSKLNNDEILFQREKDQKDYLLWNPKNRSLVSDKNFVYYQLPNSYQGQPETTQPNSIKLNISDFQKLVGPNGYTEDQIDAMTLYNKNIDGLRKDMVTVKVANIKNRQIRETLEKKGITETEFYGYSEDPTAYVGRRVSHAQDIKKVARQTKEKAMEQENDPKSQLGRKMGSKMHGLNQNILDYLVESNNPKLGVDVFADLDFKLWRDKAFESFKNEPIYAQLQQDGLAIFADEAWTDFMGEENDIAVASNMVDKLIKSMMKIYHEAHMTQRDINTKVNEGKVNPADWVFNKPVFLIETPWYDKSNDEAGRTDIVVMFSDKTASIYDHKFTDLQAKRTEFKDADKNWAELVRIREAQGLPVDKVYSKNAAKNQAWHYILPDDLKMNQKEESWNAQIGRYVEMMTTLYGIKSIRQARIIPVATSYTTVKGVNADGKPTRKYDVDKSKVAVILTGDDDLGISRIALNVEKTGDVSLDNFIQLLIANKESLVDERSKKKAYDDPKYNDRIKKLDASIQALLLSRDITKIADSIAQLAKQIDFDLKGNITFEDIINHMNEIKMFQTFIGASATEINEMEAKYQSDIEAGKENPYTTFKQRVSEAKFDLERQAEKMEHKMVAMVYEENKKGGYMSDALFQSLERQVDMTEMGKMFTHLREVNHPIVSLFSQLLDKVETNRINERRELEVEINKVNKGLKEWGDRNGKKGTEIYKPLITEKLDLIYKYTKYVKDVFPEHMDRVNHTANVQWFIKNFERTGDNEIKFQKKLAERDAYYKRSSDNDKEYQTKLNNWRMENDVNFNGGDNEAWYNTNVQYLLTPINEAEYYSPEYANIRKPGNEALLDFYNFYQKQINKLTDGLDFKIGSNFIAEIRKDTIDTMVQDGIFTQWVQQGRNLKNYFTKHDKDDGLQQINDGSKHGKKVPIFFTDSVGKENKSLDLAKSLMIFSDFVNNYKGVKDMEHAVLATREMMAKTKGVDVGLKGNINRDAAGNIQLSGTNNARMLEAYDKWINYYIYGETKEGSAAANKIVDAMTSVSSRKSVALNFLSAVSGHVNAAAQIDMIATKAQQFDKATLKLGRKEAERTRLFLDSFKAGKDATESLDTKSMFASFFFEISQEDLSFEKANSVSLSSMRKAMSKDYAFILQRWSDTVIDSTVLNTMLMSYGIDPNTGKTYPIKRLKEMYPDSKIEWRSLWDSLDLTNVDKDGNKQPIFKNQHTGEKMDDKTYTDFRRKAKHLVSQAKGNMSSADIAGYKTHMIGRLVMQFRGWIPATVRSRVKTEQYNVTMEQFEVGRWWAAWDMVGKNLKRVGGEFVKQMIPFVKGDFNKDMNSADNPMRVKYDLFIADNPHLKPNPANPQPEQITYEQYYNTYVAEVKALAHEVQLYLALASALLLLCFAAGDDELKENPALRLANATLERTMLEIGFYVPVFGIGEQYQLVTRKPIASTGLVTDAWNVVSNTMGETYDTLAGAAWDKTVTPKFGKESWSIDHTPRTDATPWLNYSHEFIPPAKFVENILGVLNTSKRDDTIYDYLMDESENVYK